MHILRLDRTRVARLFGPDNLALTAEMYCKNISSNVTNPVHSSASDGAWTCRRHHWHGFINPNNFVGAEHENHMPELPAWLLRPCLHDVFAVLPY